MSLFSAKNHFSRVCEEVASTGEPMVVTRRGKPLVRILPYADPQGNHSVWDTVEEAAKTYGPLTEALEVPDRQNRPCRPDPLRDFEP